MTADAFTIGEISLTEKMTPRTTTTYEQSDKPSGERTDDAQTARRSWPEAAEQAGYATHHSLAGRQTRGSVVESQTVMTTV
jgi:hypothetical protein